MTFTKAQINKTLRAARRLVRAGWMQGSFSGRRKGVQCYCLDGAVRRAARGNGGEGLAYVVLKLILRDKCFNKFKGHNTSNYPTQWKYNDAAGRTQDQVVAVFDRALERQNA